MFYVKTGTAEQMQLQSGIVKLVKELGAATVGLRFAEFTEEELAQFAPEQEEEQSESLLSPLTIGRFSIPIMSGTLKP